MHLRNSSVAEFPFPSGSKQQLPGQVQPPDTSLWPIALPWEPTGTCTINLSSCAYNKLAAVRLSCSEHLHVEGRHRAEGLLDFHVSMTNIEQTTVQSRTSLLWFRHIPAPSTCALGQLAAVRCRLEEFRASQAEAGDQHYTEKATEMLMNSFGFPFRPYSQHEHAGTGPAYSAT